MQLVGHQPPKDCQLLLDEQISFSVYKMSEMCEELVFPKDQDDILKTSTTKNTYLIIIEE